jgi:hypothetical protein
MIQSLTIVIIAVAETRYRETLYYIESHSSIPKDFQGQPIAAVPSGPLYSILLETF